MAIDNDEKIVNEATQAKGKKKGLPLIPILIVVVVLAAIGAVVWFVVMPMLAPPPLSAEQVAAEEETKKEAENPLLYDPENQPGIISFDEPFMLPLRKREGVLETVSYLRVTISLEVESVEIQDKMTGDPIVMSRIKDTINSFFASQYPQSVQVTNWPQLKQGLMDAINTQFKKDYHIQRVNFQNFLVQSGR